MALVKRGWDAGATKRTIKTKAGYPGGFPDPGQRFVSTRSRTGAKPRFLEVWWAALKGRSPTRIALLLVTRGCVCSRSRVIRSRVVRTEARQPWIERGDFERHLVTRRGDGDRSRLHHFRLVVPRVDLHAAAERKRCDLIELGVVECRTLRGESAQTQDLPAFRQRITQVRGQQGAQLRGAQLQSLQEQSDVVEFLRVRRVLEQFDRLLVGSLFFFRNVLEAEILIGGIVVE